MLKPVVGGPTGGAESTGPGGGGAGGETCGLPNPTPPPTGGGGGIREAVESGFMGLREKGGED